MHIIRQHTFDIDCPSKDVAKEIHTQLGTLLEQHYYPKLETMLNIYVPKGYSWNIDSLELELPKINFKNWKKELIEYLLDQSEAFFKKNSPHLNHDNYSTEEKSGSGGRFITESSNAETLLIMYLEKGTLKVNPVSNHLNGLIMKVEITAHFIERLLEKFSLYPDTLVRWIFNIPSSFKDKVMSLLDSQSKLFFDVLKKTDSIKTLIHDSENRKLWFEFLKWNEILCNRNTGISTQKGIHIIDVSIKYWYIQSSELKEFIKQVNISVMNRNDSNPVGFTTNDIVSNPELKKIIAFFKIIDKELSGNDQTDKTLINSNISSEKGKSLTDAEIFIDNAGLIILHPFIKTLFKKLGLIDNENWINRNKQHKAVLLTQYLVNGQETFFENELILNKILCGMPVEEVINTKIKLTKKDKEKCNSLLQAVTEHWKPMNKSTVRALQETFLQRSGKLDITANYELWVEEKGYDILLEQLPWGINMIKTSWMEEYLICNWA